MLQRKAKPTIQLQAGKHFPQNPSTFEVQQFLDHLKLTNSPETFSHLSTEEADKTEQFDICCKFGGARLENVGQKMIKQYPCAICSPYEGKFQTGMLVYFRNRGKISIIGHCCADKSNLAIAHQNSAAQVAIEANLNFSLRNLNKVPTLLAAIGHLRPAAHAVDEIHQQFRRAGNKFRNHLANAGKSNHGVLSVEEDLPDSYFRELGIETNKNTPRSRKIDVARMIGWEIATKSKIEIVDQIKSCEIALKRFPVCNTDDEILAETIRMSENEKGVFVKDLKSVRSTLHAVEATIDGFAKFFSVESFKEMDRWGQHRLNENRFEATIDGEIFSLKARSFGNSKTLGHVKFSIKPTINIAKLNLPDFE